MSRQKERRPGQGNDARNGREPVRKILSRNFSRICIGVTGVLGIAIALHFTELDNAIVWVAGYSGMLLGFALGNVGGDLK